MRMRTTRAALLAACLFLLLVPAVYSFDFSKLENAITEHTLDNGLRIIVMERHEAPVATFLTYANVGAVDDPKGYTGIAHMYEHMAFKGTTTLGTKDIDKELKAMAVEDSIFLLLRAERNKGPMTDSTRIMELEAAFDEARDAAYEYVVPNAFGETVDREGGHFLNAGTAKDQTIYFFSLPSNKVELWMAMESERFLNPVLREMYREREVVAEERRMSIESNPFGRLIEEFLGLSFKAHPYGHSTIGHMSDIQYYSRDAARTQFEKYYGPSNLTVAIVGDVKPKEVFKLAEKYWGRIPPRPAPERVATVEPEQLGERRMEMEDPSQPFYLVGWHIPEITHPDRPAIDALLDYLGEGRTSLLYKNLVKEKKIAAQVGILPTGYVGDKYPTMAMVYAVPSQNHNNYECEKEVFAETEKLKEELVPEEDVDKIKARAKAGFIAGGGFFGGLNSNLGLAIKLAVYQNYWGDWREMFKQLDRINTVTPEDIQRVARQYFTKNNRVVVMINTVEN